MSITLVAWLVTLIAVGRLSLLLHELAHAAVALGQTSGPVLVQVGRAQGAVRIPIGRLGVSVSLTGSGGICTFRRDRPLSRRAQLKRVLAGPAVNLALALIAGALALRTHGLTRTVCLSAGLTNALMTVTNLVPRHARGSVNAGRPNDGMQAWCLLRGKPIPAPKPKSPPRATPARGRAQPMGAGIAMGLGIGVVVCLAIAHWIPVSEALFTLAVIILVASVVERAAREGRRKAVKPAAPSRSSTTRPAAMKKCPSCGAQVQSRAKLCYCDHRFP